MSDGENSWCYVRHDGSMADSSSAATSPLSSAASHSSWWKVSDGLSVQVTEGDVLGDSNTVHFLIYTRRMEQDASVDADADTSGGIDRKDGFDLEGKPSKTIKLDTEIDWWSKTNLVVSAIRAAAPMQRLSMNLSYGMGEYLCGRLLGGRKWMRRLHMGSLFCFPPSWRDA